MDEQRKLTKTQVKKISDVYNTYSNVISNTLRPLVTLKAGPKQVKKVKARMKEIVRRLDVLATKWAKDAVVRAYVEKRKKISVAARSIGNLEHPDENKGVAEIDRLVHETAKQFIKANATIEESVNRFISVYEKALSGVAVARQLSSNEAQFMTGHAEAEIERKVKYYLARGYSEGTISRKLRDYLKKLTDGDDLIEVNGKFYGIKAFAEMTARSELHKAYTSATVDECKKVGQ